MPTEKQVAIIFAASKGFLDTVPLDQLKVWERDFHLFLEQKHSAVLQAISTTGKLEDDTVEHLTAAIKEFIASRG
jgi:F-type H+-transporting ATPase subunit alpha